MHISRWLAGYRKTFSAGGVGAGFSNGQSHQLLSPPLKSADSLMCREGQPDGLSEEEQSFCGGAETKQKKWTWQNLKHFFSAVVQNVQIYGSTTCWNWKNNTEKFNKILFYELINWNWKALKGFSIWVCVSWNQFKDSDELIWAVTEIIFVFITVQ